MYSNTGDDSLMKYKIKKELRKIRSFFWEE